MQNDPLSDQEQQTVDQARAHVREAFEARQYEDVVVIREIFKTCRETRVVEGIDAELRDLGVKTSPMLSRWTIPLGSLGMIALVWAALTIFG